MKTVKQVAELAGLSVRALHHFDHIGLLSPPTGDNGYRYYGERELLRLQQILFYRELGVSLAEIARMLDEPAYDVVGTLRDLRDRVGREIERHQSLARTIERTLAAMEAGDAVDGEGLYAGVSAQCRARWEDDLIERIGEPVRETLESSRARIEAMSSAELADFKAEIDVIHQAFVALIEAGGTPASTAAQELIARHHRWVCRSWTPDPDAYAALGRLYVEHADFRAMYAALHVHLARFLADAMAIHARGLRAESR